MSELLEFLRTHEEAFRSRSRLASLYSDFRLQRTTNPDGYTANSSAWLRALAAATQAGLVPSHANDTSDRYILNTGEELLRELQTQEYGRPLALGAVIGDAVKRKELIGLQDFLQREQSIYVKRWVEIPTIGEAVSWGLKRIIGEGRGEDKLVRGDWVVVKNVEAAGKVVMEQAPKFATSNTSRIFSRDMFNSTFAPALGVETLSSNDMDVLLRHLQRDRAAIAYSPSSGVVKFKSASDTQSSPVTGEDVSIASLRSLIASLSLQIDQLTSLISQLDISARNAVSAQQLPAAKTALRQKKAASAKLGQRTATLAQLEDVYFKIEQAADQVEIIRVMEASSKTLKSLNTQTGGVEKVQDIMEGLREDMMDVDEIGKAINEVSAGEVDEGEVDDELEALEKAEREEREAVEKAEREEREAAENAEREKKEAEEAEMTRLKLAELENVGKMENLQGGEQAHHPKEVEVAEGEMAS